MPAKKSSSLGKLIIPIVIIAAIYFMVSGGDDTSPENNTDPKKELSVEEAKTVTALRSNNLGIAFEYPGTWGEIDAQNDDSFILMFDDACIGSDCDSLYVQKTTSTSGNYSQLSELIKKMTEVKKENMLTFYEDKSNQVVSGKKLFAATMQGNIYSFELSGKGIANQDFKTILRSFGETALTTPATTPSTTATSAPEVPTTSAANPAVTYKFQSCGDLTLYPQEEFYPDFVAQVTKARAFTQPLKLKMFGNVAITVGDIKHACYSSEGKSFLALVPSSTVENGTDYHIFKYDITSKTLSESKRTNKWSDVTGPTQFGKRDGRVIKMNSTAQEGACVKDSQFNYDYVDNAIALIEVCSTCEGSAEKKCEKK